MWKYSSAANITEIHFRSSLDLGGSPGVHSVAPMPGSNTTGVATMADLKFWASAHLSRSLVEISFGGKAGHWLLVDLHRIGARAVHCVVRLPLIGELGWSLVLGWTWEGWGKLAKRERAAVA